MKDEGFTLTNNDAQMFLKMFQALTEVAMNDDDIESLSLESAVFSDGSFVINGVTTEGMPTVAIVPLGDVQSYIFGEQL